MTWAPCLAASWAAFSCFWIIDSLSPVQLACSSAPRTLRGIGRSPSTSVVRYDGWSEEVEGYTGRRCPCTVASGRRRCNATGMTMAEFAAGHAADGADDVADGDPNRQTRANVPSRPERLGPAVGRALGEVAEAATTDVRPPAPVAAVVVPPRRRSSGAGSDAGRRRRARRLRRALRARPPHQDGRIRPGAHAPHPGAAQPRPRRPDDRRILAGLPAPEPHHPADDHRRLCGIGLRIEAVFQAAGVGDRPVSTSSSGSCAGPGRSPARTCASSRRHSAARASRAATS